ncbi:NACHT domain-containing protein [Lentzea cavernae]|uniref:NACHT domain-containing protein n=1 Tax=Lentzea cavernae TaxID=2020703 RepID=UPI001749E909|nr:hypothetical protein [Lentzea cavernae]
MQCNQFNGDNTGIVVQARDVHFASQPPVEDTPLNRALHVATVEVTSTGTGRGVCIAPDLVLTAAELVPARCRLPQAPSLAVVSWPTVGLPFPVLHPAVPPETLRTIVEQVPGAPVLNRLTGAVCGIQTSAGPVFVPELDLPVDQRWLDLLSPSQLAAGGWRHLSPDLREYLRAVREQGNEHEYRFDGHSAPDLRSVFLTRWVTPESESSGTEPPERVNAEELLTASNGAQVLGEAGMGKTSLVRYFAAVSAEAWLNRGAGRAVPVPVTAKALAREGGLPDLLARGVRSTTLAEQRLVDLFGDAPLPGVPWLVLVDGLDELIDTAAQYDFVREINRYRRDERYRFVLTSRHFGFGWFDQRTYPTYVLSRFGHQDLRQFISTWFREEERSDDEAAELFSRLRSTELYELARVPLIATMLCVLSCAGVAAELPSDQTELYERYVHWQLQKIEYSDVRAKLLRWQARAGASAEQAADALLGKLRPILQELAHASLDDDGTGLLDLATARCPGLAPNAVREALLASGLVVSGGRDLAFRHETIREFLAACHLLAATARPKQLLAPRLSRREWPDLKVKLFLAAMVAKDTDLSGTLRRAMWLPYRRNHMEFIVGLVLHGVPIGARLRADLVRLLTAEVRSTWSTDDVWRRYVDWLRQIDQDATTWLLRDLVEQSNAVDEFRRFGAVVHLIEFDARANEATLLAYLRSPRTAMIAFNSVRDLLAEVDPELGLRIFSDLATTAASGRLRSHAAMVVSQEDQTTGSRLLADLARNLEEPDAIRQEAIEYLDDRGSDLGLPLWCDFVLTARAKPSRAHAANVCFQRDSEATARFFTARLHDSTTPTLKFEIAQVLVQRELEDPVVLFDLADAGLPVEDRLHLAMQFGPQHRDRATAMLISLLSESAARNQVLEIIKALQELSPERAVKASRDVAMDYRYRPSVRLSAAEELPKGMQLGVYEQLAMIRSFSEDVRMKVAKNAFRIEAAVGLRIYEQLVHTAPDDAAKSRIAVEAKRVTGAQGTRFLQALPASAQFDLVPQLNRSDAIRLLHRLAASGPTAQRMNAARKLVSVGGKWEAARAYQRIADSRGMSSTTRKDAQTEANRLSGK